MNQWHIRCEKVELVVQFSKRIQFFLLQALRLIYSRANWFLHRDLTSSSRVHPLVRHNLSRMRLTAAIWRPQYARGRLECESIFSLLAFRPYFSGRRRDASKVYFCQPHFTKTTELNVVAFTTKTVQLDNRARINSSHMVHLSTTAKWGQRHHASCVPFILLETRKFFCLKKVYKPLLINWMDCTFCMISRMNVCCSQ